MPSLCRHHDPMPIPNGNTTSRRSADLAPMSLGIIFVGLVVFFVGDLLVRTVAIRLVFGQTAHANEYRASLRLDLERLFIGFHHFAHIRELTPCPQSRNHSPPVRPAAARRRTRSR